MEEIENKTKKCQYCGEEKKNPGAHERFCKSNPANTDQKKQEETKTKQDEPKLIITNVQPCVIELGVDIVPWYKENELRSNKISYKIPRFIGNVDGIPYMLVSSQWGFIPAHMLPGFLGLYPYDHEFVEPEPIKDELPAEPIKAIEEAIKSEWSEDNIEQVITPPAIHAQEPQKKSIFAIFGRKEKKKAEVSAETKDMLRQIANVGKT